MGLFNFVKGAGERFWDAVTSQHDKDDQVRRAQEYLNKVGMPDASRVNIQIINGKATVIGDSLSQEAGKKILVAVGNISDIVSIDDQVKTAIPTTASQFYTIKSGSTLGATSKQVYGNANLYNKIFEADRSILKSLDKIYPRQVLHIPEEQLIAGHRLLGNRNRRRQILTH